LVIVTIIVAIITTITFVVITPVIAVITTVVVTSVITAVVASIITSIPIVIARIGLAVTVISSIRSTVTIVEALATVAVVLVVASSLLGGRWDSKGMLQLLALPHGVLGVAVELALVVHDHIEVTFEEGGRSWWICQIGFARSLARPDASIIMVSSVEVMHYCILCVNQFVDVGHEVTNGFCISFVDLLKQLDVGDSLFVVGDDVVVFNTCKGVAVLEVAFGVLTESFITSHPHSGEVVSIARTVVGRLVVGREEARQSCRMDLPGPTTSVGTRTDYSVGPWDYLTWVTRHLMAWGARTMVEKYSDRKLCRSCTMQRTPRRTRLVLSPLTDL
jgi:hypothetical protein